MADATPNGPQSPKPPQGMMKRDTYVDLVMFLAARAPTLNATPKTMQELMVVVTSNSQIRPMMKTLAMAAHKAGVKIAPPSRPQPDIQNRVLIRQLATVIQDILRDAIGVPADQMTELSDLIRELPSTIHGK